MKTKITGTVSAICEKTGKRRTRRVNFILETDSYPEWTEIVDEAFERAFPESPYGDDWGWISDGEKLDEIEVS